MKSISRLAGIAISAMLGAFGGGAHTSRTPYRSTQGAFGSFARKPHQRRAKWARANSARVRGF